MEISLFKNSIEKAIDSTVSALADEIKHIVTNRLLEYQTEEYRRNLFTKTLIHRAAPKNLLEFYVPLYLIDAEKKETRRYIHHSRRGIKTGSILPDEFRVDTTNIKSLFEKARYITIIGGAGSGKSTIIRYLFVKSIQDDFKVPVKIELRYLNNYGGTIHEYLVEKVFKLSKLADSESIIERLLHSGKFVVFLDGYDEVTSDRKEAIAKEIDDLVKVYNKNNYILTSRPHTNIELLPSFHNYFVSDLTDEEVDLFVKKQLPSNEQELIEKIIEAVHNEDNASFRVFLSNPLLLSMFIISFQSYANIPSRRSIFYRQVFDALFSQHDSMSKLAFVREKRCGLSKESIERILNMFSFLSFFEDKYVFSEDYIFDKLNKIKDRKPNLNFENELLIHDLVIAVGIMNKDGVDYTFPHRSLQEFFAVEYISSIKSIQNKQTIYSKIQNNLFGDWRMLIDNENFYSLLFESDEISFLEFVIVPYLERGLAQIEESIENEDIPQSYDAYLKFRMISRLFRNREEKYCDFFKVLYELKLPAVYMKPIPTKLDELTERLGRHFARFKHGHKNIEDIPKEEIMKEGSEKLNAVYDWVKGCRDDVKGTLSLIKARIEEEEESDSSIIDLV